MTEGYVHVYTGDGKGKSTAAFGLAVRAAGANLRVYIGQFVKGARYSEIEALECFGDMITVRQYGRGCFLGALPEEEDQRLAADGLAEIRQVLASGEYDLVILDEINIATHLGLIDVETLLSVVRSRPSSVELVLTGRSADRRLIEMADLVTEMREVKHYYAKGVLARKGIEL